MALRKTIKNAVGVRHDYTIYCLFCFSGYLDKVADFNIITRDKIEKEGRIYRCCQCQERLVWKPQWIIDESLRRVKRQLRKFRQEVALEKISKASGKKSKRFAS